MTSVLVVDDEENLLLLLERVLTRDGFAVKTASGAHQALALLERETFDLAIVDIKMFPVDGITLLDELRERSPATRVVMTTAYPTPDSRMECLAKGAAVFLTKPLDLNELKSVARNLKPA